MAGASFADLGRPLPDAAENLGPDLLQEAPGERETRASQWRRRSRSRPARLPQQLFLDLIILGVSVLPDALVPSVMRLDRWVRGGLGGRSTVPGARHASV